METLILKEEFDLPVCLLRHFWLVELEFNGPVNTVKVMLGCSVYLTKLFLGRLSPLSS